MSSEGASGIMGIEREAQRFKLYQRQTYRPVSSYIMEKLGASPIMKIEKRSVHLSVWNIDRGEEQAMLSTKENHH